MNLPAITCLNVMALSTTAKQNFFPWIKMGNCLGPCRLGIGSCIGFIAAKQEKVLQIVKTDGKILEFGSPSLVKDILVNFPGCGISLSKEAVEHLQSNYELKLGNVYYVLPSASSAGVIAAPVISPTTADREQVGGVKRIKVVITKQQLQQLLARQISFEEVLLGPQKRSSSLDSSTNWKPKLDSIPEGIE